MPEKVLDIVAEYPQEQHIAKNMGNAAVHEHRAQEVEIDRERRGVFLNARRVAERVVNDNDAGQVDACHYLFRHERKGVGERLIRAKLLKEQKDQDIQPDDRIVDDWRRRAVVVIIADREHISRLYQPPRRLPALVRR